MLRIYLDTAGRIILLKSWWQQQNISGEKTEKVEWGNSFSGRWTFRVYETRFDDVSWWYSFCSSFFFCAVKANTETGDGVGARVSRIQKTPRKMLKKERIFLENSRRNNGISIEVKFMNEKCRSSIINFISRFRIRHKAKWEKRRVSAFNKQNSCVRCCCIFSSSNFCINCSLPELLRNYCTWQHWNKCSVLCSADGFGRFHTLRDLYARANENEVHWNAKAVLAWRALTWSSCFF